MIEKDALGVAWFLLQLLFTITVILVLRNMLFSFWFELVIFGIVVNVVSGALIAFIILEDNEK